jgi:two-component system, chemotaxis family, sensor kinase CheA
LTNMIKHITLFSGTTILGDGSVIMILDPVGLAKAMGQEDLANQSDRDGMDNAAAGAQRTPLLLFRAGNGAPMAVPLSLIARLEHIHTAKIEHAGGRLLIQYRDQLMPLLPMNDQVTMQEKEKAVLVFADRDRSLGLVVDEIIDIVETTLDIQLSSDRPGFVGSTVIADRATDIVDVGYYLHKMDQNWFKNHDDQAFYATRDQTGGSGKRRLLLVDDSPFFRNMLTPILSIAGYDVTVLDSAIKALQLCDQGVQFDLIISDIEMPEMDGLEFVQKVKSGTRWSDIPMVALTSHSTPQDIEHGYKMGFNKYVPKFDREVLLSTLTDALSQKGLLS